jgi:hypothetical protein
MMEALPSRMPIVRKDGTPDQQFQYYMQRLAQEVEAIRLATEAAQARADEAYEAATTP